MVNLIAVFHLETSRDVAIWEHCTLSLRFLDVAKFTTTALSLLILFKLLFPVLGLKMSSLPTLALKSLTKFSYGI
jgi:hypothetical protein